VPSQSAIAVRLSADDWPANSSGWTTSRAFDISGRSCQTRSIGLRSTATSSAPRAFSDSPACFTQSRLWSHGS